MGKRAVSRQPSAVLTLAIVLTCVAGCSSQTKLLDSHLAQIAEWLPGRYDNLEQARRNAPGVRADEALALVIVPIYSQSLGDYAFYLHEMAADDPRRVLGQRVITFEHAGDRIVQATFTLAEPLRWRDAYLDPNLFKSLFPHQDLKPLTGCALVWKKEGDRFTAANDPSRCRMPSRVTGTTVNIEMRAELTADRLALSDRSYDEGGSLVAGNRDEEPFFRFVKRAD
jgi:hypothetical protein